MTRYNGKNDGMMIRGAIFDLDGVLLDSMSIWNDLGARYLRSLGITPEDGLNEILFSMSMEQGAEYLLEHYSVPGNTGDVIRAIAELLQEFYFEEVPAKPGAEQLLQLLKRNDVPMIAATSSPREHVTRALERIGLLPYLRGVLTTTEVGMSKHSPEIYRLAAERLGTRPSQTLVFEDSLYALATAHDAGFRTVGVYDAYGETDQAGMHSLAEWYLTELSGFRESWLEEPERK